MPKIWPFNISVEFFQRSFRVDSARCATQPRPRRRRRRRRRQRSVQLPRARHENHRRSVVARPRRQELRHLAVQRRSSASTRLVPAARFPSFVRADAAQHLRHFHLPDSVEPLADHPGLGIYCDLDLWSRFNKLFALAREFSFKCLKLCRSIKYCPFVLKPLRVSSWYSSVSVS